MSQGIKKSKTFIKSKNLTRNKVSVWVVTQATTGVKDANTCNTCNEITNRFSNVIHFCEHNWITPISIGKIKTAIIMALEYVQ